MLIVLLWPNERKKMLSDDLKVLLASNFAYYLKAQYFHWNVEGPDFAQLHDFFAEIYTDAYSGIVYIPRNYLNVLACHHYKLHKHR